MRNTIQIILTSPKNTLPDSVFENGYVSFDIDTTFDLGETLSLDKLDIFGNFTDNYVISSSLPKSSKNLLIFELYQDEQIPVTVLCAGAVLPFKKLQRTSHSDTKNPRFEIQFVSQNPLKDLKEQKISDLDFGVFNYDTGNLLAHFQNDVSNLSVPFYHPICNYGKFTDTTVGIQSVKIQDLRPWVREYNVLQKMFQKIGWVFKSPIHETGFGKKIGCYLNDSFTSETLLKKFSCLSVSDSFQNYTGSTPTAITVTLKDNVTAKYDYTGVYGNYSVNVKGYDNGVSTNGYFNSNIISNLSGKYKLRLTLLLKEYSGLNGKCSIRILKNGTQILDTYQFYLGVDYLPTQITTDTFDAQPSDSFTVSFVGSGASLAGTGAWGFSIGIGSNVELIPVEVTAKAGLYEAINKYIKDDYKSIDFFKGVVHWCNGQLDINYIKKTVTMYPPNTLLNLFETGEDVKGYCLDAQIDLRPYQLKHTSKYDYLNTEGARYYTLRYSGGDSYLNKTYPFSKKYDFGTKFKNNEFINENPFFEPTGQSNNHSLSTIKFPIAVLWDNTDGVLSTDLNPRRCIFENRLPSGADGTANFWTLESTPVANLFPTCYVKAETSYNNSKVLYNLCYGDIELSGWGDLAYTSELDSDYNQSSFEAIFYIDPILYDMIDFRKKYIILYENYVKAARLKQVRDYKYTSELPTPLNFKI